MPRLGYKCISQANLYKGLNEKPFHDCAVQSISHSTPWSDLFFRQAQVWTLVVGFSVAFGSIFSKTWRVHVLFTNKKMQKKVSGKTKSLSLSDACRQYYNQ